MDISTRYELLDKGQTDVTEVFTTDGPLSTGKYVLLEDDKHVFPPYNATLVVARRRDQGRGPRPREDRRRSCTTGLTDRGHAGAQLPRRPRQADAEGRRGAVPEGSGIRPVENREQRTEDRGRADAPSSSVPRNVKVLSAVSFFQDAASELVYPVLPLFITGTLGAPPSVLGLIEGIAEGTAAAGKAVSGRISDLWKRKPLIALGYGISSLAKPLIGLASGWGLVLVARFFDRVGKGVRTTPRDALIADDTPQEVRGRAFGLHRAADSAGAVVGPLLGLALYEALDHRLRPLFFVAFVPAAISVGLIAFVHDRPSVTRDAEGGRPDPVSRRDLPSGFWRVTVLLGAFALVNFSDAFIILRAQELGLGFASIILAYALYNLVYASLSYPAGSLSDRIPRRRVFAAGLGVFAVAYIGLGLAPSSGWVWLLLPLYGAYTALTDGVARAWVADQLPAAALGTGMGIYQGLIGVGALVAGVWAGLLWGETGSGPLIAAGAVVGVLAVTMAIAGRRLEA